MAKKKKASDAVLVVNGQEIEPIKAIECEIVENNDNEIKAKSDLEKHPKFAKFNKGEK